MKSLTALIAELENKISFIEQKNITISQASVGWHLEHSLLALVKMISAIENSNPADYKKDFNFKLLIVLAVGRIPKGKAKAPEAVKPGGETSVEALKPLIEKAKQKAESFEKLSSGKFFTHPFFGDLKINKARKIIRIHTNHHIKIINDIICK